MVKTRRLNASPITEKEEIAQEEASAIDRLTGKRPLRLHDVGDCDTEEAARIIAEAAKRYKERGGVNAPVWTYTHSRNVPRAAWGEAVSVLRSCETEAQVKETFDSGYAACIEFAGEFPSDNVFTLPEGTRVMPCPEQTGKKENCIACGLCFHADALLRARTAIGFKGHGQKKKLMTEDCEF